MNDPTNAPIDIEEMRQWLIDHRASTQQSWSELAKRIDIPSGTLSQFGSAKGYAGDERKLSEKVYRYRQLLSEQAKIDIEAPELPEYFKTPTSDQINSLLSWAQRGRIIVAATGAGLGKTKTAEYYKACFSDDHAAVEAVGRALAEKLSRAMAPATIRVPLARRERALFYRQQGLSDAKIALQLGITENGVGKLFKREADLPDRPGARIPNPQLNLF